MCEECARFLKAKKLNQTILNFLCDCGNKVWIKSAVQPENVEYLVFRCTKCDTLIQKKPPKH